MAFQSSGLAGYNEVSPNQLKVAQNYLPDLIQLLISSSDLSTGPIQIADYGCSEGQNSMLTFAEAFTEFRKFSSKPIHITHTDLPHNSWTTVYTTINSSEKSYIHLENIYYSTLGKSFFSQLFPSNTIHIGYSSYAMHYLSQKQKRPNGEFGWIFPAIRTQAFADMKQLIEIRIEELVPNGFLQVIVGGRDGENEPIFERILFGSMKNLLDRGVVTSEEFRNYVWHSYPYNTLEITEILQEFSEKIEVLKCEHGSNLDPRYARFLEDKNQENYKNSMVAWVNTMMKNPVFSCLSRNNDEKSEILSKVADEVWGILQSESLPLTCNYIEFIIKKNNL